MPTLPKPHTPTSLIFFKHMNIPNPLTTYFNARHFEKSRSSKGYKTAHLRGKHFKSLSFLHPTNSIHVNLPNHFGTYFKARHFKKSSSSKITRLFNPEGHISKASHSTMKSFLKHVNIINPVTDVSKLDIIRNRLPPRL